MSDLLQENLLYLYKYKKDIFETVQQYLNTNNNEKKCKLVYEENGFVNLTYVFENELKSLYANDGSDLETWLEEHSQLKNGEYDVVMYGMGLTHHLAKLIEFNPSLNLYIFEPDIDIFVESMKVVNIEQLLLHPQVKILRIGNLEEHYKIFHALLNIYSVKKKIDIFIPFYAEIDLESIRKFYNYNYNFREAELIGRGFEQIFGTQPYRNSIRNLVKMSQSLSIESLRNKFDGCSILVVGAGPSLELDIELIKQYKDKMLIIAAGSSIQSLLHFGIEPHMVVSMDPGEATGRAFKNSNTKNIPLVFVPQIYFDILNGEFSQLFYAFFNSDVIINYLLPDLEVDYMFRATNSVTGTVIQIAKYLGAKKIILAGQDMSFPEERYYAQGANHLTVDNLKQRVTASQLKVENVKGSMNRTNPSMKSLQKNIENLIESIEGIEFINTSSLGAKIKGTKFIPFLEVVKNLKSDYDFSQIKSITGQGLKIGNIEINTVHQRINKFIENCNKLMRSCDVSLKIIMKIEEYSRRMPEKAMNMLAKLEKEFSIVTEHQLFKSIIPSWNRSLTKKYDQLVINIEKEPTIIGKSKLLNEIVVPYIKEIKISFNEMIKEFEGIKNDLVLPSVTMQKND
ncbi:motility associated factor glycosyltransferase family protein [Paenibacillus camelliae]|uniref:motility associated factor glycosyltransferase family protein n=1 Tax=Paenibacillus camelliae TaxID=512410 RepID=UPI0020402D68|nr:6-hydroxymethylpterin diphosphokinase MptE-like protein [Paenibacillus camelliae]MCM3635948.1 DUF115 domain-containing protein [Paenibacillus camelliae]